MLLEHTPQSKAYSYRQPRKEFVYELGSNMSQSDTWSVRGHGISKRHDLLKKQLNTLTKSNNMTGMTHDHALR